MRIQGGDQPLRVGPSRKEMAAHRSEWFALKLNGSVLLAWVLSWSAGYVDSMGVLALFHVLVANMTGNTIAVASGWSQHNLTEVLRRGAAIPFYFSGMFLSRSIFHFPRGKPVWRAASQAYFLEAVLLTAFVALGTHFVIHGSFPKKPEGIYFVLLAILTIAMGIQNAALLRFGKYHLLSTHVTGTLENCAEHLAQAFMEWWDGSPAKGIENFLSALFYAMVWSSYLVGAIAGAFFYSGYGPGVAALPAALLFGCSLACRLNRSLTSGAENSS